ASRENYWTRRDLRALAALRAEIAQLHGALSVQRAEWAYLNRPERLRDLVGLNFARLPLLPMEPGQFGSVRDVALPLPPLDLTAPVDLSGDLEGDPL
ncbi:MAG TPA: cell division protein FtsL, partial [Paracoccaceae bacterium]|nr:cell division protein FtsL [Paracoccaceae bacterium]